VSIRRRAAALVVALALAGTLAFPSVAAPSSTEAVDGLDGDVELAPSSEYAYLADGELVVDVSASNSNVAGEGLNPDSVTTFADVFRVRYTGSEHARVWLSHDSEAVTFYADGESVESAGDNVTLAPKESVALSLRVETDDVGDSTLLEDVTVHAQTADSENGVTDFSFAGSTVQTRAPDATSRQFTALGAPDDGTVFFDAQSLALGSDGVTLDALEVRSAGGSLSIDADAAGNGDSVSRVAGAGADPLGAASVTVDAGDVSGATMRFSVPEAYFENRDVTPADLAVYRDTGDGLSKLDVERTGARDGRVRFAAETSGFSTFVVAADRARLRVADASLAQTTAATGESVAVTANVTNAGSAAGERTVSVSVDGSVVAERAVAVGPGETAAVTAFVALDDPDEYAVSVDGVEAGTLVVESPDSSDGVAEREDEREAVSDESSAEVPVEEPAGFGLAELGWLLVVIGVVAAALAVRRRPCQ